MKNLKTAGLIFGPVIFFAVLVFADFGENTNAVFTAAAAALIATWWITEAIPIAVTALIPIVLFPLFGILKGSNVAESYINSTIFLFIGGFIIAIAMQKWNLHKRIALNLISLFGKNPSTTILGFMIASAFLSMWISNTATAVMLLPIGMALLLKVEEEFGKGNSRNFAIALMLGIAYSCSIGGIATLIGTPPNLVFHRIYAIVFPDNPEITFGQWILFGLPLSSFMLLTAWLLLTKVIYKPNKILAFNKEIIREQKKALGKFSFEEKAVLAIFSLTALLWVFRKDLQLGLIEIPGWSNLLSNESMIDDGTVAVAMAIILFMIPAKSNNETKLLNVKAFREIPWEIIILFGGGFALAKAFISSGLSEIIGGKFAALEGVPIFFIIFILCVSVTFLTELTSNTGTSEIILPILAALSTQLNTDALLLMIPATISASMAFMMPVATPPNAIVFGSGRIRIPEMARAGIILNIIGGIVISIYSYFYFA